MEIERYTLATGETAMTGFNRFWKHWGLVLAILVYFANLWPGWVDELGDAGDLHLRRRRPLIAVVALLVIGASLTLAPVVYVALERLLFVKVAAVVALMVAGDLAGDLRRTAGAHCRRGSRAGRVPDRARIRPADGRGRVRRRGRRAEPLSEQLHPRQGLRHGPLRPAAGEPGDRRRRGRAARQSFIFEPTAANMARWRRWWRFANLEQALTFG